MPPKRKSVNVMCRECGRILKSTSINKHYTKFHPNPLYIYEDSFIVIPDFDYSYEWKDPADNKSTKFYKLRKSRRIVSRKSRKSRRVLSRKSRY